MGKNKKTKRNKDQMGPSANAEKCPEQMSHSVNERNYESLDKTMEVNGNAASTDTPSANVEKQDNLKTKSESPELGADVSTIMNHYKALKSNSQAITRKYEAEKKKSEELEKGNKDWQSRYSLKEKKCEAAIEELEKLKEENEKLKEENARLQKLLEGAKQTPMEGDASLEFSPAPQVGEHEQLIEEPSKENTWMEEDWSTMQNNERGTHLKTNTAEGQGEETNWWYTDQSDVDTEQAAGHSTGQQNDQTGVGGSKLAAKQWPEVASSVGSTAGKRNSPQLHHRSALQPAGGHDGRQQGKRGNDTAQKSNGRPPYWSRDRNETHQDQRNFPYGGSNRNANNERSNRYANNDYRHSSFPGRQRGTGRGDYRVGNHNHHAPYDRNRDGNRARELDEYRVVTEIEGDLFQAPEDNCLAHCVAEDMRMGSGIAVTFRQMFKQVDNLLDQGKRQGQVAVLEHNGRYIYYLVTKPQSTGKPTMNTLERSLAAMHDHVVEHNVKKIAMPRIGCGLDRLEWRHVKPLIERIFSDTDVTITVYYYNEGRGKRKPRERSKSGSSARNPFPQSKKSAKKKNKQEKQRRKKQRN